MTTDALPGAVRGRDVLVFDLDGTLVDSAPDIHRALNTMLAEAGREALPLPDVRGMIGDGAAALVARAFAGTGEPAASDALRGWLERFLAAYAAGGHEMTEPYEGVVATLAELRRRGHRLGICTNKPMGLTVQLLDHLGLAGMFGAVLGGDSLPIRKPHPGHLLVTIERLAATAADVVMIGDSATDVALARAAGVPVAVVTWGYTNVPAAELGADLLIQEFPELLGWSDPVDRPG